MMLNLNCWILGAVFSILIIFSLYSTQSWTVFKNGENRIFPNGNCINNESGLNGRDLMQLDSHNHYQLSELTKQIQKKIYNFQHPPDCKKAKKMQCLMDDRTCAFGCQIHQLSYCLIVAYSKKRVLMPVLDKWRYSPKGWKEFFLPLTNCTLDDIVNNGTQNNDEVINIPFYNYVTPALPPALPNEFAEKLIQYHRDPPLFWVGQFMMFLMRYSNNMQKYIENKKDLLKFDGDPIVGIHVRRTDKVYPPGGYPPESELFEIKDYMKHVSNWFDVNLKKNGVKRRVYLATDDPKVINDIISFYPDYEILSDYNSAKRANSNKYSNSSLMDMITSIHLLSSCDFVVCTFSSNIGRFIYELMQSLKNGDFTNHVLSLDTIYYYYGQYFRHQMAIIEHHPSNLTNGTEIELNIGDILEVKIPSLTINKRNKFDGLIEGRNLRTNKIGKYPIYKVAEKWKVVDIPT